jgi:ABC-type dipeptide/oligopeptide/nickel transport system permease component
MWNTKTHSDGIWGYTAKKVFIAALLLLVSMMIFFFVHVIDRGTYEYLAITQGARCIIASDDWWEQQRENYHFNEPLIVQYGRWIIGFFKGDWGYSFYGSEK